MKIVFVGAASDIHTVRWVNALSEKGNDVYLCYLKNHYPKNDQINPSVNLIPLNFLSPAGYYLATFRLKKILKKINPDILNIHYASGYGTLGRLVNFHPYLLNVYGSDVYDFPYKSKRNMIIAKKNLKAADLIASTSHSMALQVTKLIDISNELIQITPFGVNQITFKNMHLKKNKSSIKIGTIKKLSYKYGINYGILAVDYLVKKLLPQDQKLNKLKISYDIYGEGPDEKRLKDLVNELKLNNIVHFKGRIPNKKVPYALNEMDYFIATSVLDSESFGVAIVEAMSCEIPVIVSDVDGFIEVTNSGKCGIVVKRKDYISLGNALFTLLKNDDYRNNLIKLAKKRVLAHYDWNQNVNHMLEIYQKLIKSYKG